MHRISAAVLSNPGITRLIPPERPLASAKRVHPQTTIGHDDLAHVLLTHRNDRLSAVAVFFGPKSRSRNSSLATECSTKHDDARLDKAAEVSAGEHEDDCSRRTSKAPPRRRGYTVRGTNRFRRIRCHHDSLFVLFLSTKHSLNKSSKQYSWTRRGNRAANLSYCRWLRLIFRNYAKIFLKILRKIFRLAYHNNNVVMYLAELWDILYLFPQFWKKVPTVQKAVTRGINELSKIHSVTIELNDRWAILNFPKYT